MTHYEDHIDPNEYSAIEHQLAVSNVRSVRAGSFLLSPGAAPIRVVDDFVPFAPAPRRAAPARPVLVILVGGLPNARPA